MGAVTYGGSHTAPAGEARIKQTQHQNPQPEPHTLWATAHGLGGTAGRGRAWHPVLWREAARWDGNAHGEEKGCVSTAESAQCAPQASAANKWDVVSLINPVSPALGSARGVE